VGRAVRSNSTTIKGSNAWREGSEDARQKHELEKRKKLGLLEKKHDYKIRAEDFHQKEKKYKKLKEEARTKNPDEFYFKMVNSKTLDGEHMNVKEEKTLIERNSKHNKLLGLVNFKKSVLVKVIYYISYNYNLRKKKN